jgi:hypothetical protein
MKIPRTRECRQKGAIIYKIQLVDVLLFPSREARTLGKSAPTTLASQQ